MNGGVAYTIYLRLYKYIHYTHKKERQEKKLQFVRLCIQFTYTILKDFAQSLVHVVCVV